MIDKSCKRNLIINHANELRKNGNKRPITLEELDEKYSVIKNLRIKAEEKMGIITKKPNSDLINCDKVNNEYNIANNIYNIKNIEMNSNISNNNLDINLSEKKPSNEPNNNFENQQSADLFNKNNLFQINEIENKPIEVNKNISKNNSCSNSFENEISDDQKNNLQNVQATTNLFNNCNNNLFQNIRTENKPIKSKKNISNNNPETNLFRNKYTNDSNNNKQDNSQTNLFNNNDNLF